MNDVLVKLLESKNPKFPRSLGEEFRVSVDLGGCRVKLNLRVLKNSTSAEVSVTKHDEFDFFQAMRTHTNLQEILTWLVTTTELFIAQLGGKL